MKTQDTNVVQIVDDRIIIGPVTARWPNLVKPGDPPALLGRHA